MNTHVARHPGTVPLSRLAQWLRRLDTWIVARRMAAADQASLSRMSARELRDIGLDPGRATNHGEGDWARDWA